MEGGLKTVLFLNTPDGEKTELKEGDCLVYDKAKKEVRLARSVARLCGSGDSKMCIATGERGVRDIRLFLALIGILSVLVWEDGAYTVYELAQR